MDHEALIQELQKPDFLRLHLGEMTAQELRTAQATVRLVVAKAMNAKSHDKTISAVSKNDYCILHGGSALSKDCMLCFYTPK